MLSFKRRNKLFILCLVFIFIFIFGLNIASANENITLDYDLQDNFDQSLSQAPDEVLCEEGATFSDLSNLISNGGSSIKLTKNYTMHDGESHVEITKNNIFIDGQGHTLNAHMKGNIFGVTGSNITFKNITFINGLSVNGGAIGDFYGSDKYYTVIDCTFINNTATNCGGALYSNRNPIYVYNSTFINNRNNGDWGGGAIFSDRNIYVDGCEFYGNTIAKRQGSAIRSSGGLLSVSNSNFAQVQEGYDYIQASSYDLSGMYLSFTDLNKLITNSNSNVNLQYDYKYLPEFDNGGITISKSLTINGNGHALDANGNAIRIFTVSSNDVVLNNISFKNSRLNSAGNAVLANNPININYCTFMDNWASGQFGGAVNLKGDNSNITYCTFTGNKAKTGAGIVVNSNNNHILYSYFNNNSRNYGGNMNYWDDISVSGGKSAYVNYNMLLDYHPLRQGGSEYYYNNWYGKNSLPDSSSSGAPGIPNYLIASFDAVFLGKNNNDYNYLFNVTFTRSDNGEVADFKTDHLIFTIYDESGESSFLNGCEVYRSNKLLISKVSVNLGSLVLTKDFGISSESGTFTDLNNVLLSAREHGTVNLVRDYKYNSTVDNGGVTVSKSLTINGNGHTIDANKLTSIFKITADNVVLKNMILTNAYLKNVNDMGVDVFWSGNNGVLDNVTVKDNVFDSSGNAGSYNWWNSGMIYWSGSNGMVNNTKFISNKVVSSKGIIIWTGSNGAINNSYFYDFTNAYNGGVGYSQAASFFIYWDGDNGKFLNTDVQNLKLSVRNVPLPCYVQFTTPGYVSGVSFVNCQHSNRGQTVYDLNMPFSPVEDHVKDFTGTLYKQTPYITLNNKVFTVNSVRTGSISYTIDGGSAKTAQVDEDGHFILDFDSSKNHYIKVTYDQNTFYNSVTSYFNYESATGNSAWYVNGAINSEGTGLSSNPFKTLKNAINYANVGDIIYVAPGTYTGSDNIALTLDKSINICRWGNNGDVVFDAQQTSEIFTFDAVVNLTSLVFKNGVSDFGGAIIFNKVANIIDCTFINNNARYGGAVNVAEGVEVTFNNSRFTKNIASLGGGAIYSWGGTVNIINSIFNYSLSDYGGAVFSLEGNLYVLNSTFNNNQALSFGGGIYKRSGHLTINKGYYYNNTAYYDGGAAYISHGLSNVENAIFESNIAGYGGGAIHSLAGTLTIKDNTFINNISYSQNGWIDTPYLNSFIDFANYTLIVADTSNFNGSIPSYFSLSENGWDTSVKNQGSLGICWDYAAIVMVETAVKKATGIELDLSEGNVKNLLSKYADYGWNRDPNAGGGRWDACSYLSNSLGPILESTDPTGAYGFSPLLGNVLHVSNIAIVVRSRDDPLDNDNVKEVIMKYGAVKASMNAGASNGYNYYQNTTTSTNHAVAIVGWDDNYSKNNFINNCPGDGAWIVKNSWGSGSGKNGYIYISYYDVSFAWGDLYYVVFNGTVQYNRVYQYDYGNYGMRTSGGAVSWYKNTYTSVKNEGLTAFSTYFNAKTEWEVSVYVGDELKHTQTGSSMSGGYFTFNFDKIIPVVKDEKFTIVLKVNNKNFAYVTKNLNTVPCGAGVSYYSTDGVTWKDLNNNNQVACLKVFTCNMNGSQITINPIDNVIYNNPIIINYNVENITTVSYTLKTRDGITVINRTLVSNPNQLIISNLAAGDYIITIFNDNNEHFTGDVKSSGFTVKKAVNNIEIIINNKILPGDVTVKVKADVDGIYKITIGDKTVNVNVKSGQGENTITLPAKSDYSATTTFEDTQNYTVTIKQAKFNVTKGTNNLKITIDNTTYPNNITIKLTADIKGTYTVSINGTEHQLTVKNNGETVSKSVLLTPNIYYANIIKYSSDIYDAKITTTTFKVTNGINTVKVQVNDIKYNESATVYVTASVAGNYTVNINGEEIIVEVIRNGATGFKNTKRFTKVGKYYANVTSKQQYYTETITNDTFKVFKAVNNIKIDVNNTTYPNMVTVKVSADVSGDYVVDLSNGEKVTVNVKNGAGTRTVKLNAGAYSANIAYSHENYDGKVTNATFNVFKAVNTITVKVSDVKYNQKAVVNVTADVGGVYIVDINGTLVNVNVKGGFGSNTTTVLTKVGKYYAKTTFVDDNYEVTINNASFNVFKAINNIKVEVNNTVYPEVVTIKVTADIAGEYIVKIHDCDIRFTINEDNSNVLKSVKLTPGIYSPVVEFDNDDYQLNITSVPFKVENGSVESLQVIVNNVNYSYKTYATVYASVDGQYIVSVNNRNYTVSVENGMGCSEEFELLNAGEYLVKVHGNIDYYNVQFNETVFNVLRINSTLDSHDVVAGYDAQSVRINVSSQNAIKILYHVYDMDKNLIINSTVNVNENIELVKLDAGQYTIVLSTLTDSNHNSATREYGIIIKKSPVTFNIEVDNTKYDQNPVISIKTNATGIINIILDNETYMINLSETKHLTLPKLPVNQYTVKAVYCEDNKYCSNTTIKTFKVDYYTAVDLQREINDAINHNQSEINLTHNYIFFENETMIKINKTVKINGNNHIIDANKTLVNLNINADNIVLNNLTIINSNHTAIIITGQNTILNNLHLINNTADKGGAIQITGNNTIIKNTEFIGNTADKGGAIQISGNTLTIENTTFYNNNAEKGAAIYMENSDIILKQSSFNYNKLSSSISGITLDEQSNVKVDEYTKQQSDVLIDLKTPELTVESVNVNDGNVEIKVKSNTKDGKISLSVNNEIYTSDIENGHTIIKINNLATGNYNIPINYSESLYYNDFQIQITFKVSNSNAKIINNENINIFYLENKIYTVRIIDFNSSPVKGAAVTIKVNGNIFNVNTDDDGYASIGINLKPGNHIIETSINGMNVSNNINVKHIINAKKTTKVKKSDKKKIIKITLKGHAVNQSKKVKFTYNGKNTVKIRLDNDVKNQNVDVNFKGKTYKVKLNKKGVGKLKLTKKVTKKLKKGKKYKLKVTYNGSKLYKKVMLTVKFNGKNYKVKTNKQGIAKFKVSKKMIKKLKKGKKVKYTIIYKQDTVDRFIKIK